MARIKVKMGDVGCRKPGCQRKLSIPHRHHKGNEAWWVYFWASRPEFLRQAKVRKFIDRYYEFREEDVVRICAWHHAEIHSMYSRRMSVEQIKALKEGTNVWTWKRAHQTMKELRKLCDEWLQKDTPGIDPKKVFRPKPM